MSIFEIMESVNTCQFCHIAYECDARLPKYLGLGKVFKLVETSAQVFYDYEGAVKRRIERQGGNPDAFVGESLRWGVWELRNKVITHKGNRYLRFYGVEGKYPQVTYLVGGRPATDAEMVIIKDYLSQQDTTSHKQADAGLTENQVVPRTIQFENILSFSVNGMTYTATKSVA